VLVAEDGVDALLKLGRGPIDLILSDINLPIQKEVLLHRVRRVVGSPGKPRET